VGAEVGRARATGAIKRRALMRNFMVAGGENETTSECLV
jgi:hypothetical protein